jgi:hypothetical protein
MKEELGSLLYFTVNVVIISHWSTSIIIVSLSKYEANSAKLDIEKVSIMPFLMKFYLNIL